MSKRISHLMSLVPSQTTHFYDLFCDHGHLGREVFAAKKAQNITFIDIKKHLTDRIQEKVGNLSSIHSFHQDARLSLFEDNSFVSLCGVGGILIKECLERYQQHENFNSQMFLLSPNMHCYELRYFLREQHYHCIKEDVISDRGRTYEILIVAKKSNNLKEVFLFNESLWDLNDKNHLVYLQAKRKDLLKKHILSDNDRELLKQLNYFLSEK